MPGQTIVQIKKRSPHASLAAFLAAFALVAGGSRASAHGELSLDSWLATGLPEDAWIGPFDPLNLSSPVTHQMSAMPIPTAATPRFEPVVIPVSATQDADRPGAEAGLEGDSDSEEPAAAGAANANTGGEQPTFGRQPTNNTLQFLRRDSVLIGQGKCQFDFGLNYVHFENFQPVPQFDSNGEIANVVQGRSVRRLLYSPFGYRYGLTDRLQFNAFLPVGWANTQFSITGATQNLNNGGIGDLTAGFSYLLQKGRGQCPDIIGSFGFTAPTGDFNAPVFGIVPGSALGQGFWALNGQLLIIHRYDPIILFYGGGYRHLFERNFNNIPFQPGEQIDYQLGVGFAVNDRVTMSTALIGYYITNTSVNNQRVLGTNLEPISLRFAVTVTRNKRIIEPFAAVGMTQDAPSAFLGTIITLQ